MTVMMPTMADPADAPPDVPRRQTAVGLLLSRPGTVVCLAIVALYVLAGIASFLPVMDRAINQTVGGSYDHPHLGTPAVWFGTDILGRSVLWRTVYGTRVALLITLGASLLSIGIGATLGVIGGYFGGWVDAVVVWLFTTVSSIPGILLIIAIAFVLESHQAFIDRFGEVPAIIIAFGLTDWVGLCRLLRGEVFKHRSSDYVMAARAAGAGTPRILFRHVLPNVFHLVIITFSLARSGTCRRRWR